MAKGRQIYLQAEEIDQLAAMVEWRLVSLMEERSEVRDSISWSVRSMRSRGKKPEIRDINPLLPHPELDYRLLLDAWERPHYNLLQLVEDHRELLRETHRVQSLLNKLYY